MIGEQCRSGGEVAFRGVVQRIHAAVGAGGEAGFEIERDRWRLPKPFFARERVFLTTVVVGEAAGGGAKAIFATLVLIPADPALAAIGADAVTQGTQRRLPRQAFDLAANLPAIVDALPGGKSGSGFVVASEMVVGDFQFGSDITRAPLDASKQLAAGAFSFIKIACGKAITGEKPPVIGYWRGIDRRIPAKIVATADRVI